MALTQTQIIQSLGEALSWFEKELSWGVAPQELNHLTGRIGELYAAMITRGQMALKTNQRGYDIISADNERVSVKTITSSNHISFNPNTLEFVDRIIVLRINIDDEMGITVEELLDSPTDEALIHMNHNKNRITLSSNFGNKTTRSLENLRVIDQAEFKDYLVKRYESQSIEVSLKGEVQAVAKPHLRKIAKQIGVDIFYDEDKAKNTRQLGKHVIDTLSVLIEFPHYPKPTSGFGASL